MRKRCKIHQISSRFQIYHLFCMTNFRVYSCVTFLTGWFEYTDWFRFAQSLAMYKWKIWFWTVFPFVCLLIDRFGRKMYIIGHRHLDNLEWLIRFRNKGWLIRSHISSRARHIRRQSTQIISRSRTGNLTFFGHKIKTISTFKIQVLGTNGSPLIHTSLSPMTALSWPHSCLFLRLALLLANKIITIHGLQMHVNFLFLPFFDLLLFFAELAVAVIVMLLGIFGMRGHLGLFCLIKLIGKILLINLFRQVDYTSK